MDVVDGLKMKVAVSTLGKETQSLVKLIFDNDMFSDAMKNMDIGECVLIGVLSFPFVFSCN